MPNLNDMPLLSLLIMTLPFGATLIWLDPTERYARWITLLTALVDLLIACLIIFRFDNSKASYQLTEHSLWIPTLNIHYSVGVDGISVLFLPLTVVLFLGVIIASWNSIRTLPRLYYTMLLLLESATLGIFISLDTILFFLFWELALIPGYFLISLWGIGPNRRYAAVKYTLFMLLGGIPLLFAFVLLAFNHAAVTGNGLSFELLTLLNTPMAGNLQTMVFFLLLAGFAIKTPLFPFHTWLPLLALEGPAAMAALITGLKLGAYGLIRFAIPLAPQAAVEYHWLPAGLGVIGILYGALIALQQNNLRLMLAFASISHVGLVVLAITSYNMQGIQGAVYQLLNFTLVAGGLFLLTGFIHHRTGSTHTHSLGGAAKTMPLLAGFYLLFGLAAIGLPGTNGFPAELLMIIGVLKAHTGAGLAALFGIVLSAAYFLRSYRLTFYGPLTNPVVEQAQDLRKRELILLLVMTCLVIYFGLFPAAILDVTQLAGEQWVTRLSGK
ncbi:MAG: NADH-quinone oxidoreductase subunit M [Gammaproteobacteria bacterium]|nr:NADH-quinone oxidoreductase subunit M [Gammaproteobacteria bacterium]MDH5653394.1 NADH-quinone oxidoreductase subunit M [Gammaproteobacteria bacterium]